jgi:hypothetical protein
MAKTLQSRLTLLKSKFFSRQIFLLQNTKGKFIGKKILCKRVNFTLQSSDNNNKATPIKRLISKNYHIFVFCIGVSVFTNTNTAFHTL